MTSSMERTWLRGYAVAQVLYWMGYGVYYTYSRMLIEERMGQAYSFVATLAAAETAPLVFSIVFGFLADRVGRRRVMLLGLGEAGATCLMGLPGLARLPALAALAASIHSVSYTALTGALLAGVTGSGYAYSLVAAGGSVGWGLGGLVAGLLHPLGPKLEFAFAGLLEAIGYIMAVASTPPGLEAPRAPRLEELPAGLSRALWLAGSLILSSAGLTLYTSVVSLKLKAEIVNPLLYGLTLSTATAFAGAAVRPVAGRVSDTIGHARLLALTTIVYMLVGYGMLVSHGLALAILWVLPIYPFRDVAMMLSISRMLSGSLQATAAGIASFSTSISGFLVLLLSLTISAGQSTRVFTISMLLLALSLVLLSPILRDRNNI